MLFAKSGINIQFLLFTVIAIPIAIGRSNLNHLFLDANFVFLKCYFVLFQRKFDFVECLLYFLWRTFPPTVPILFFVKKGIPLKSGRRF